MSDWAVVEVNESINKDLVPDNLQMDYQNKIKRYEYVILANQILDLTNQYVKIEVNYPFSDIFGHEYEDEMVKAYNAGVIEGDGRGLFRPNDDITRQEIASLICHLMKAIDPTVDWTNTLNEDYSDKALIDNWAMNYINYCYARDILQGTGKDDQGLDKIEPLEKATREEAIVLLLRIANHYELAETYDIGTIDILTSISDDSDNVKRVGTKYYKSTAIINDFAAYTSLDLALYFQKLALEEAIDVVGMDRGFVQLDFMDLGSLSYLKTEHLIEVKLTTNSVEENVLKQAFIETASFSTDTESIEEAILLENYDLIDETGFSFSEEVTTGVTFSINYNAELGIYQYHISINNEL